MKKIISLSMLLCSMTSFAIENELRTLSQSLDALAQKLSEQNILEKPVEQANYDSLKINDITIHLIQGDITKLRSQNGIQVDVVVNAANKELRRGSGVCGAIFEAAQIGGKDAMTKELQQNYPKGVQPGEVAGTRSYGLASEGVTDIIHAVGPIYKNYNDKREAARVLSSAYMQSMVRAKAFGASSIAFPFISSAIYGYPKPEAANIALKSIKRFAENIKSTIHDVYFVLFSTEDLNIFRNALAKMINEEI